MTGSNLTLDDLKKNVVIHFKDKSIPEAVFSGTVLGFQIILDGDLMDLYFDTWNIEIVSLDVHQ